MLKQITFVIVSVKTVIFIKINYLRTRDIHTMTFEVSLTCKEKAYLLLLLLSLYYSYVYLYAAYYTNNVYSSTILQYNDNTYLRYSMRSLSTN